MSNIIKVLIIGAVLLCPVLYAVGTSDGRSLLPETAAWLQGGEKTAETQEQAEETPEETQEQPEETTQAAVETTAEAVQIPNIQVPDIISGQKADAMWVNGDTAYEMYYFNLTAAELYAGTVNRAAASLAGQAKVYSIIAPLLESVVLTDDIRKSIDPDWKNEVAALDYYDYILGDNVYSVPVYPALLSHRDEYIFFRTDHHWTGRGAYYAYREWAKQKGIEPNALESFERFVFTGFLGSLYRTCKSPAMENNPDYVEAFKPNTTNQMTFVDINGTTYNWNIVNDVSTYLPGNKYGTFCGGDNPYSFIANPNVNNGQVCVVIKDSYGNSFIPYLTDHFQYIYWFDYRYYSGDITAFAREHGATDVIFISGISPISDTGLMQRLSALIP